MKFGIDTQIPVLRPWQQDSELKAYNNALERAELAESLGFDYVWIQEHHCAEEYCHISAPEVFMAAVSQRTKNIRLGLGVSVLPPPFSPPLRIAERRPWYKYLGMSLDSEGFPILEDRE
ncbi:MAG: LLM class flavin-dependent oxidoreductase [Dehalococcoidia bacterium]